MIQKDMIIVRNLEPCRLWGLAISGYILGKERAIFTNKLIIGDRRRNYFRITPSF